MLQTVATVFLLGMMSAFAVCAVLLNAGEHARRRRKPARDVVPPVTPTALTPQAGEAAVGIPSGDRRLPVGDFLFGALALRGSEPLAFPALADAAAGSGMSVAQVLAWVERAEAGGLIERVAGDEADEPPAVRLTDAGMELARSNRRGERARKPDSADAARA